MIFSYFKQKLVQISKNAIESRQSLAFNVANEPKINVDMVFIG